jgi:hypothetical protein
MLLLIGDVFGIDLSTYINGAVVSLRVKGDRLCLWLKKIDDINLIKTIGMKFKDLLNIPSSIQIIYEVRKKLINKLFFNFLVFFLKYHESKFDEFNNEIRLII